MPSLQFRVTVRRQNQIRQWKIPKTRLATPGKSTTMGGGAWWEQTAAGCASRLEGVVVASSIKQHAEHARKCLCFACACPDLVKVSRMRSALSFSLSLLVRSLALRVIYPASPYVQHAVFTCQNSRQPQRRRRRRRQQTASCFALVCAG